MHAQRANVLEPISLEMNARSVIELSWLRPSCTRTEREREGPEETEWFWYCPDFAESQASTSSASPPSFGDDPSADQQENALGLNAEPVACPERTAYPHPHVVPTQLLPLPHTPGASRPQDPFPTPELPSTPVAHTDGYVAESGPSFSMVAFEPMPADHTFAQWPVYDNWDYADFVSLQDEDFWFPTELATAEFSASRLASGSAQPSDDWRFVQ